MVYQIETIQTNLDCVTEKINNNIININEKI